MSRWRPDWDLHVLETAGPASPLEMPARYAEAVGRWRALLLATKLDGVDPGSAT